MGEYCCYLLHNAAAARTYCGVTNNLSRRLRQHNGDISGGARYTTGNAGRWRVVATVEGFANRSQCLSFEWWVKHPPSGGLSPRCARLLRTAASNHRWWRRHVSR